MTLQEYLQGLSKVISELVGDKLAVAKGSNPIPSVYIERQKPPKPLYPYCTTTYIGRGNYGSKELYSSFCENTNTYNSYFNRRIRLRAAFYGKYGDNVLDTADELGARLRTAKGIELLERYMPNAGLTGVSEPSYTDELLTTDYQEFAFITIDFWVTSTITDSEFYTITSGEVEGKLYTDYEQQEEPLTLTTTFEHSD